MSSAIHTELLRSYSDGLEFYDFTGCDVDDIGRWMTDAWRTAMDPDAPDDEAVQNFWFARACQFELRQRSRPIVRQ